MELRELPAQPDQRPEQLDVVNAGNAGEVGAQKLVVSLAVGRRVEDGVDVVKRVFRAKGFLEIASPSLMNSKPQTLFQFAVAWGEVGLRTSGL